MELHERIRHLRKSVLHLTQESFAEKLGVSRSVIKNIELNLLAKPDQKLSLMKLMCKEFNVNEEWLLNGTGSMFVEPETFSLDEFVRSRGYSDLELEILKAYFELDYDVRKAALQHFKSMIGRHPETPEELEKEYPPVGESGSDVG